MFAAVNCPASPSDYMPAVVSSFIFSTVSFFFSIRLLFSCPSLFLLRLRRLPVKVYPCSQSPKMPSPNVKQTPNHAKIRGFEGKESRNQPIMSKPSPSSSPLPSGQPDQSKESKQSKEKKKSSKEEQPATPLGSPPAPARLPVDSTPPIDPPYSAVPSQEELQAEFSEYDVESGSFGSVDEVDESNPILKLPSRMEFRKKLRIEESFLIDPILPRGTMNLIGGPSGIGKSTWLFQTLYDWSHGRPVLGKYKSTPCPFVYVSMDRGVLETDRTLRRLGYGDWDIPIYSIEDLANEADLEVVFDRFPNIELFVIEGLQAALPDGKGSQNRQEMRWAISLRRKILNKGKTMLATTHSPKSQIDTAHARSNFLGSVSLHACFGTMISFDIPESAREASKGGKRVKTDNREVLIQGRDFPDIRIDYTRDPTGRFRLMDEDLDGEIKMDSWFADLPIGTKLTTKLLEMRARSSKVSRATLFRWLDEMMKIRKLNRPARGIYFKA